MERISTETKGGTKTQQRRKHLLGRGEIKICIIRHRDRVVKVIDSKSIGFSRACSNHAGVFFFVLHMFFVVSGQYKKHLHSPGIGPGPTRWQRAILPLNYECFLVSHAHSLFGNPLANFTTISAHCAHCNAVIA